MLLAFPKIASHGRLFRSSFQNRYTRSQRQGAWEEWIAFFLRGIDVEARKTQETSQWIIDLHAQLKEDIRTLGSIFAFDFLEAMFIHPVFSSRTIRKGARVKNTQTLFNLIKKFEEAGIIQNTTPNRRRNKIYKFTKLLEILRK